MIRLPPLHTLIAFEASARLGSFLAAAEELCLTQSAVSHRMKALEDWLGAPLFIRGHRRITLTEDGRHYLEAVQGALRAMEVAGDRVRRNRQRLLRVSVAPAFGAKWLVGQLGEYQAAHPEIEFALSASTSVAPLRNGDADVGLHYGNPPWPGLECVELSRERIFPVCDPTWATRLRALAPDARLGALLRAPRLQHPLLPWREWLDCAAPGRNLDEQANSGPRFDDAMMMLEAAAAGTGIALSVGLLARPYLEAGTLARPFDVEAEGCGFYALIAPDVYEQPWVRSFVHWLHARAHRRPGNPT